MSKAKKLLANVLDIVASETEVSASKIASKCSETEVVNARWICVKLLSEQGFYPSRIAELMRVTPRYVQYIITDFEDRIAICKIMRINYEKAKLGIGGYAD